MDFFRHLNENFNHSNEIHLLVTSYLTRSGKGEYWNQWRQSLKIDVSVSFIIYLLISTYIQIFKWALVLLFDSHTITFIGASYNHFLLLSQVYICTVNVVKKYLLLPLILQFILSRSCVYLDLSNEKWVNEMYLMRGKVTVWGKKIFVHKLGIIGTLWAFCP